MSNRPLKVKKKVVVEDEQQEQEVEYRSPGKTSKDLIVQVGVGFLILAFVLAPMLVFVFADEPQPIKRQEQQIDDNDAQIQRYSKELQTDPKNAVTLANLGYYTTMKAGTMQLEGKDDAKAKTLLAEGEGYLRRSLEADANYSFAQSELARNLLSQEKFDEAGTLITQGIASADTKLGDSDTKVAAEAKGRKAELLGMASYLEFKNGNTPGAIAKISEVIELTPGNPTLYQQRAGYYMQTENKDAARADLATMVDIGQKTGDQRAAMIGQMMLEQLDKPAVVPGATPAAGATAAPVTAPATTGLATPAAGAARPAVVATPRAAAPTAPATPR